MFQDSVPAGSYNDPFLSSVYVSIPSSGFSATCMFYISFRDRSTEVSILVTLLAVKRTKIVDAVFFCLLPRPQPDPPLDGRSVFKNMRRRGCTCLTILTAKITLRRFTLRFLRTEIFGIGILHTEVLHTEVFHTETFHTEIFHRETCFL